jgi:threonine synthase
MPEEIPLLPAGFFSEIVHSGVTDIARSVARALFGDDIPHDELARIVTDALNFEIPLVRVEEGLYALELFHGPTLCL